jgi:hypothetical protein
VLVLAASSDLHAGVSAGAAECRRNWAHAPKSVLAALVTVSSSGTRVPESPFGDEGEGSRSRRRRPDLAHCELAGTGVAGGAQFVDAVTVFETLAMLSWVWFMSLRNSTVTLLH